MTITATDHLSDDAVLDGALATMRALTYLGDRATISDLRERTHLSLMAQQEILASLRAAGLAPKARREIKEPGQVRRVERCRQILERNGWHV